MRVIAIVSLLFALLKPASGQEHIHKLNTPFEQLRVAGNIHLLLLPSESNYLEFESASFPESLVVEQDLSQLVLKTKTELKQSEALEVKLYLNSLSGLELVRGAVVRSADTLRFKTLSLRVDTGGKAEFAIVCDAIKARVNQGSDIILSGSTRSLEVTANTVANFLGYEFEVENAFVKAATGAQVKVYVTGVLNASASGKAFVGYDGNPDKKEFSTSLGGKINPRTL
jgi:hypothetical protein